MVEEVAFVANSAFDILVIFAIMKKVIERFYKRYKIANFSLIPITQITQTNSRQYHVDKNI